jgi:Domain of unknown function (DUF222)/HNH endonuclease
MRSAAAEAVWSAVDELAKADLDCMPDAARLAELKELWPALCAAQAQIARRVGAVHVRGAAAADGSISTPAWLRIWLRLDRGPAARMVKVGTGLDDLPDTTAAVLSGEISLDHAAAIADAGADLGAEAMSGGVEKVLVDYARRFAPAAIRQLARYIKQRALDDDEAVARQERLRQRRWFDAVTTFEGAVAIKGLLDPVAGQTLLAALAAYTTGPDPQADSTGAGIGRTATQRRADAVVDICAHALANPDRGTDGGDRPHLHVTVPLETLQTALREGEGTETPPASRSGDVTDGAAAAVAHLFRGTPPALIGPCREPVCAQTARRLACDAGIIPVILGSHGEPLDIGRLTRAVPTGLRRALALRDGGCRFPGCDRPAGWCDAHHLTAWADGGPTSLTNLVLLCARHHTMVHEGGWRILLNPVTGQVTAYRPGGTRHDLTSRPRGPTRGP